MKDIDWNRSYWNNNSTTSSDTRNYEYFNFSSNSPKTKSVMEEMSRCCICGSKCFGRICSCCLKEVRPLQEKDAEYQKRCSELINAIEDLLDIGVHEDEIFEMEYIKDLEERMMERVRELDDELKTIKKMEEG